MIHIPQMWSNSSKERAICISEGRAPTMGRIIADNDRSIKYLGKEVIEFYDHVRDETADKRLEKRAAEGVQYRIEEHLLHVNYPEAGARLYLDDKIDKRIRIVIPFPFPTASRQEFRKHWF